MTHDELDRIKQACALVRCNGRADGLPDSREVGCHVRARGAWRGKGRAEVPLGAVDGTVRHRGEGVDVALIELSQTMREIRPLRLATTPPRRDAACEISGYPRQAGDALLTPRARSRSRHARLLGARALAVYCEEAAAGHDVPLGGLSGSPVLVDGAVVGTCRACSAQRGRER